MYGEIKLSTLIVEKESFLKCTEKMKPKEAYAAMFRSLGLTVQKLWVRYHPSRTPENRKNDKLSSPKCILISMYFLGFLVSKYMELDIHLVFLTNLIFHFFFIFWCFFLYRD
uniref:Uncharacterized protein n=1 Tax=Cacopsylla melanoneura TaxID=428564 RepID=A0A8D8LGK2_9HEMI